MHFESKPPNLMTVNFSAMQYNKMIPYLSNIIVHHYFTDERFKSVVELKFAAFDDLIGTL